MASTDFNQGATSTRTSPQLIDKKGGASVINKAPDQNSQNSDQALFTGHLYNIDVKGAFATVKGFIPISKNTKEALADPMYWAH
jgi:hypothetical protein